MAVICKDQKTRLCSSCGQVKSIDHFNRVLRGRDDLRHCVCRPCRNRHDRKRRLLKRRQTLSKKLSALRQTQDPRQVEILAAAVIESFGGVTPMMKLMKECLANPGRSGFQAQLICTGVDLIEKAEKQRPQSPRARLYEEYERMSDKELENTFCRYLRKFLASHPTIAVAHLESLGWKCFPPEQ